MRTYRSWDSALDIQHLQPRVFIYLQTSIDVIPLMLSPILPVIPLLCR